MKRLTTIAACLLLLVFALAALPAAASAATNVTVNIPVELKDIPTDVGVVWLAVELYDKNKNRISGKSKPVFMPTAASGQKSSVSKTETITFSEQSPVYYSARLYDQQMVPLDQALKSKGYTLTGAMLINTGLLPIAP